MEEWKQVVGYEGKYRVSSYGRVWSYFMGGLLKLTINEKGYVRVRFSTGEKYYGKDRNGVRTRSKWYFVHRLVLAAFVGPCPEGQEVLHKNHKRNDNRLENLRYGTHVENMAEVAQIDEVGDCPF